MEILRLFFQGLVDKFKGVVEAVQDRVKYGSSGGGGGMSVSLSPGGMREMANRHPMVLASIIGVIVLCGFGYAAKQIWFTAEGPIPTFRETSRWYYTTDDGANYFADDINKVAPFPKDGKQALRAHVFSCDGKPRFVGYVERQTPRAQSDIAALPGKGAAVQITAVLGQDREVKLPKKGDKDWTDPSKPDFAKIVDVKCPDAKAEAIEEVFP